MAPVIQDLSPAGTGADDESATNLTARQLLDDVLARMPREALLIEGDLMVRKARGAVLEATRFQMYLHWGEEPARAQYVLLDSEGRTGESMTITRSGVEAPRMTYMVGGKTVALPDLYAPIRQTDVSWMDLTLSFLWWPGGEIVGQEVVRGYTCYIVEISRPAVARGAVVEPAGSYSKVKLWVEEKMHVMLQAEGLDSAGKPRRRLWVTSCKKINDRWMIKDMEIEGYPIAHRTKLIVRDVNPVTQPADKPAEP
jgi:hypothetical protein